MKPGTMLVAVLLAVACHGGPAPVARETVEGRPLRILTTFQPLYSLACAVVGERPGVEVVNVAPANLSPHEYDPLDPAYHAEFVAAVRSADAIVCLPSLSLAVAFDRLYPVARAASIRIVALDPAATWDPRAPRLMLLPPPGYEGIPGTSQEYNPHVWLSLSHAALLADNLARDLGQLDPAGDADYRANARRFRRELLDLRQSYQEKLARLENTEVIALTEGLPYLTQDLDLHVADYLLGVQDAAEVQRRVQASGARVALAEEEPSPELRAAVERAGARIVVLSTLEHGHGNGPRLDPQGYLLGMRENLEALYRALAGPAAWD